MKNNTALIAILILLLINSLACAQTTLPTLELGLKAGGTFTSGYTTVPAQDLGSNGKIPELNNKQNGIGTGYTGGLWVRRNFSGLFLQTGATYNRYVLNQKTNTTLDVKALGTLAGELVPAAFTNILQALPVGQLSATLDINTISTLQTVSVPVLIGKRFARERIRLYAGPSFWFVTKAEVIRDVTGQVNPNANIPQLANAFPLSSTGTTDLLADAAGILRVKPFTYALEVGAGVTFFRWLDLDLRVTAPVGGIYKNKDINGLGGATVVTLGYRIISTQSR